mmetsp:Transcript_28870/g.40836  ORF Transcript_28870/g.40836 Transcript_28870/m.40836 type:complete len:107 (-) Transcript_28870:51-371(-)
MPRHSKQPEILRSEMIQASWELEMRGHIPSLIFVFKCLDMIIVAFSNYMYEWMNSLISSMYAFISSARLSQYVLEAFLISEPGEGNNFLFCHNVSWWRAAHITGAR